MTTPEQHREGFGLGAEPSGPLSPSEWTKERLITVTNELLSTYAETSIDRLHTMVRRGLGREVLGSVPNRPEDEQLWIDTAGENILSNLVRDARLPSLILGEHNNYKHFNTDNGSPYVVFPIDSFDNTSQYKRGLDTPPYTVVGAFFPDGEPIGGIVGNIKDKLVYVASRGQTIVHDLETGEISRIRRSERKTIKDDGFTLATYLGSNQYAMDFFRHFGHMVADMPPKAVLYPGGGAYIYGLLATGAVDAYVMFNEPRTEIDPGLPLALAAGCTVVSVDPESGSWENYKFDESRHDESVPLFIAACTPELRDEIIDYYVEGKKVA